MIKQKGHTFLRWWLLLCATIGASIIIYNMGLFHALWEADQTKLSFAIIIIYSIVTCFIGFLSYSSSEFKEPEIDVCWFAASSMSTLGMLGTVAGFLLMLGPAFAAIDIGDNDKMTEAITTMASGMSTALTTTLVGLICSLLTKTQLVNLQYGKSKI